jgi:spermidine/putrescine-binding protein
MMSAFFYYLPNKATGPLLRFWHPVKGKGPIQNDMWSVCTSTKKPVLAHLFLNFMLDNTNAYSNFVNFNGYQPPLNEIVPEDLVKKKVIPETLSTCVLTESDLGPDSLQEMTLTTTGQSLWQNGYSTFLSGA